MLLLLIFETARAFAGRGERIACAWSKISLCQVVQENGGTRWFGLRY